MKTTLIRLTVAALIAIAVLPASAHEPASSRVIVSATLNDTLLFFDAETLAQTQPPLVSRGGGPVRLAIADFGRPLLFAANHGVEGSVGIFALDDVVTELPASPAAARPGAVGIDAATVSVPGRGDVPMVFVTNTYQALGGCSQPKGSVTAYEASRLLAQPGSLPVESLMLREIGTLETSGAVPYAVSIDPAGARAFVSSNCSATLDTIEVSAEDVLYAPSLTVEKTATRATGSGPDGTAFDVPAGLNYTVNISGNSVSVHDATTQTVRTTVSLQGARPIDTTLADSPSGARWLVTANGGDDTISLVDRSIVEACVAAAVASCAAEIARIPTAVPGGAPEGVAYDPASNRVFAVNKTFPPTLSVIQISESEHGVSGTDIARIPLNALGTDAPIPAVIAFDAVVQTR